LLRRCAHSSTAPSSRPWRRRSRKLAWGDEPFRFKGKYYEYPYPQEGTPWPAHEWTREYGFPGEVDEAGRIQMINVVPKPYQRPHPPLFQAFSVSVSLTCLRPFLDLIALGRRTVFPEEIFDNVNWNVEAELQRLDQIFAHDPAGKREEIPVAADQKKALREGRTIIFIDESGLSERPHRVRT
jgi:hypothetical protein